MSKDIRSYFQPVSKKTNKNSPVVQDKTPQKKARKPVIIASDDEDIVESTPQQTSKSKKPVTIKRKAQIISSDSDSDSSKHKPQKSPTKKTKITHNEPKLKPVDIAAVFSNTTVKQSKVVPVPKIEPKPDNSSSKQKKKRKSKNPEVAVHDDEDFEKTLLELDDDLLTENVDILDKTMEEAMAKMPDSKTKLTEGSAKENTPNKKRVRKLSTGTDATSSKKPKLEHTDSGIDPDQEAFEKKRYSAMLYQKYKNRGGPKHHGSKELPKGKPDCLKNLTFLRTGVMDSLESEEFENLIKGHGGRLVHSVSKKVNYLVVGDDPGPSKLEKARAYNIPNISEDELLDLILKKSGMPTKFVKNVSEDMGIASEEQMSPKKEEPRKEKHSQETTKNKHNIISRATDEPKSKSPAKPSKKQEVKASNKIVKSEDLEQIERPILEILPSSMSWTEKYKPKDVKGIIGQQGDSSNLNKLKKWLLNWNRNQRPEVRAKIPRPSPWAKNDDGAYYKCALLSGPPGVGKTTTATLICQELGYDVVEFNASDTRSKKLLQSEVGQLLCTNTIAGFASGQKKTDKKRVLLMDEVDGMAGNEDRGGIQELINLIKGSSIPIICMCNDRNHTKMRSLVNYCFDLRFSKPRMEQIKGAMLSICFKEGIKIPPNALTEIINGTGCDIRQTLNHLSLWTASNKTLSVEEAEKEAKVAKKDTVLGPWEVARMVFSEADQKTMSLSDKSRLFFYDYSLGPLFVQENYLKVQPNCPKKDELSRAALAADAISMGDIIDSKIRGSNNWSLLESQAMFSSVLPGYYMSGHMKDRINFPGWLGKNSTKNKFKRMLSELQVHTRISTSGSKLAMKLDYLVPLRDAIIKPLKLHGAAGISTSVNVMKEYNLLREDLDNLVELCRFSANKNPFSEIESKIKAAFTRAYNKDAPLLPFAPASGVSKKKAAALDNDLLGDDVELEESDNEKDDLKTDAMIKIKDKRGKKDDKAGSSKASDGKKGKSRAKKTK